MAIRLGSLNPWKSEAAESRPEPGGEPIAPEEAPAVPVAADAPASGDGYVPMSEWIEDFDRRR